MRQKRVCPMKQSVRNICLLLLFLTFVSPLVAAADHPLRDRAMALIRDPELEAYAGWLDYRLHEAEIRPASENDAILTEWVKRLERGENPLPDHRGAQAREDSLVRLTGLSGCG